ncbi:DUF3380 domain-containing protein [Mucilaginibacter conchicola]|uniref:DUF3380 domain-containing protein n=1 Tax=Mucilaginibacter conchicola TaxID=2303333 RepID=A0A372NNG3_9SPHI|nr:N-acetylmuramidase family protein [Mucilaginibacter conchicola]RFZ90471.1 DUF3380 domain-containing protein [Mucilaginibacter conchicola]
MEKKLSDSQLHELAMSFGYEYASVKAIVEVESNQRGFSEKTGRIIIQFEPTWFKRFKTDWQKDTVNKTWQANKVGDQTAEWAAFNSAFASSPNAAMKSTSIGMMQIMGFHYAEIGFKTVGAMWDFAKLSEYNQVILALCWIKTMPQLSKALKAKDWPKVAYYYNGSGYKTFSYDTRLARAYQLAKKQTNA